MCCSPTPERDDVLLQRDGDGVRLVLGRLLQLRLGRLEVGLAALELGAADEILLLEGLEALVIGRRQVPLGLRRGHLGPGGIGRELVVLRVQLRQHLAGLHALAQFGLALRDLARHPEAQARLDLRPHLGGELQPGAGRAHAHGQHLHGAHGFGGGRRLATGSEDQGGTGRQAGQE